MTTFHMETLEVLALAQQVKSAVENSALQISQLNSSLQFMDWAGPSRDEFELEAKQILIAMEKQVQLEQTLAARIEQEIAEWEQTSATLAGFSAANPVASGGGLNRYILPFMPVAPVFTPLFFLPWPDKLPDWLYDLYRKLFPSDVPVSSPNENPNSPDTETELGKLLDEQPTLVEPSPKVDDAQSTRHGSYDIYHDVPPKSQGNSFGSAACLPTSLSMVTDYYHGKDGSNRAVSTDEFLDMLDTGDGRKGVGVGLDRLNDDLSEVGYDDVKNFQSDMPGLRDELKNGPVVVNVKVDLLSLPERSIKEGNTYNHAMVVKAISGTDVLLNDPWTGNEMKMSQDQFERMWKNGENWVQTIHP
jgi:hypothetical protein